MATMSVSFDSLGIASNPSIENIQKILGRGPILIHGKSGGGGWSHWKNPGEEGFQKLCPQQESVEYRRKVLYDIVVIESTSHQGPPLFSTITKQIRKFK